MEVDSWWVGMGGWGWGGVVNGVMGWVIMAMACEGTFFGGSLQFAEKIFLYEVIFSILIALNY